MHHQFFSKNIAHLFFQEKKFFLMGIFGEMFNDFNAHNGYTAAGLALPE
jgi:hypothetical protein